jgi:hypothetical protein
MLHVTSTYRRRTLATVSDSICALCPSPLSASLSDLLRDFLTFALTTESSNHQNTSAEAINLPISPLGEHTLHTTRLGSGDHFD